MIKCGDIAVDLERGEIFRGGRPRHVEPQVFSLICYLIANRHRLVSKDELFDTVWNGRIVSDSSLNSRINAARKALGDNGKSQRVIRTLARRGFRFVAPVEMDAGDPVTAPAWPPRDRPARAAGDRPSIVALPFRHVDAEVEGTRLVESMTEDMTDALGRYGGLNVISPTTALTFQDRTFDIGQVGRDLGVDYAVEGSIRIVAGFVRICAELTAIRSRTVLWSDRYELPLAAIDNLQDEIARQIAGSIEPHLAFAEQQRRGAVPAAELGAWDLYHRGVAHLYSFTDAGLQRAATHFEKCIAMEPGMAQAYARLAYVHVQNFWYGPHAERSDRLDRAIELARTAISLDDREALGHLALGRALALQCLYDRAIAALERAVRLNPSFAQAHFGLGQALFYAGRPADALAPLDHAMRLSPRDPHIWTFHHVKALALYELDRLEEAKRHAETAVDRANSTHWALATLASILGALGQRRDADPVLGELARRIPGYTCLYAREEFGGLKTGRFVDTYVDGLRAAGLH